MHTILAIFDLLPSFSFDLLVYRPLSELKKRVTYDCQERRLNLVYQLPSFDGSLYERADASIGHLRLDDTQLHSANHLTALVVIDEGMA